MGRQTFTQTNWFGGQIAEQRHGNASDEQYAYSAATIENLIVRPTGSLTRRPGTKFIARTDGNTSLGNEDKAVRLIPFVFGHESANNYVLEFGHNETSVTANNSSNVFTATGHGLTNGDIIRFTATSLPDNSGGTNGITADTDYYVRDETANTFKVSTSITTEAVGTATTFGSNGSGIKFHVSYIKFYKSGVTLGGETNGGITQSNHLRLTGIPYNTNEKLQDLQFVQSADILFLVSPKVAPYKLSRSSGTTNGTWRTSDGFIWTLEEFPYKNGPYLGQQEDSVTGSTDTVIEVSGSTPVTAHTGTAGRAFINENFGGATQQFAKNGAYEGYAGNFASLSYFQVKNHGLQEGMLITLSGGNGSGTSHIPRDGTWTVRNPTANTFQIATSATADISIFSNADDGGTVKITAEGDAEHKVFAQYYAKGATPTLTAKDKEGNPVNIFKQESNGRHFRISLLKKGQIWWVWGKLSGITGDQNTATLTLEEDCPVTSDLVGLTSWKFGEWYTDQYPHHIAIFQQRMIFARNSRSPQTVWFSGTADFENFAPSEALGSATGQSTATGASIIGDQILATNGMTFTFDSGTIDEIQWMVAQQKLVAGSTGGIYAVYGSEQDLTITPFNFTIKRESTQPAQTGSNAIPYDNNILFIQGTGKKIRLITYGDISSSATSADLTFRATDILHNQAVQVVETDIPNFVSWFRLKDGTIVGLTYIPQQETVAWHQHKIGGDYSYNSTREGDPTGHLTTDKSHAVVLDMCTIPSSTRDQLWMLVRRTIPVADTALNTFTGSNSISPAGTLIFNDTGHGLLTGEQIEVSNDGGTLPGNLAASITYYVTKINDDTFTVSTTSTGSAVEYSSTGSGTNSWSYAERIIETVEMMEDWMTTEAISESKYLDGHVTHTGTNVDSGELDHLEGETVGILADGSVLDNQVVNSSGQFTTAIGTTTTIIAGMRYISKVISLPISIGPQGRIRIGNKKRIHRTWAKIHRTPNFKYATYTENHTDEELIELVTRTIANKYGEAPHLASETKELIPKSQGFTDGQFLIQQSDPMPLNILAYEVDFETNDN